MVVKGSYPWAFDYSSRLEFGGLLLIGRDTYFFMIRTSNLRPLLKSCDLPF
jgi:hypothetical protein